MEKPLRTQTAIAQAVVILCMILLGFAVVQTFMEYTAAPGIDFYHFWGVAKAQQFSNFQLGSPYLQAEQYAEVLNSFTLTVSDQLLREANNYRQSLSLTGTPLGYWVFAGLPQSYSAALLGFRWLQLVAFLTAVLILTLYYLRRWTIALIFSLVLALIYFPLFFDLRVGNLNALQFWLMAVTLVLVERLSAGNDRDRTWLMSGGAGCLIVFSILFKVNVLLMALALLISLQRSLRPRQFGATLAAGGGLGLVLLALPGVFFHAGGVWLDWFSALAAGGKSLAGRAVEAGNFSTPVQISQNYGISLTAATIAVAVLLVVSLGMSLVRRPQGAILPAAGARLQAGLRQPSLLLAIATVATLALSPLVWPHYYILSLLPAIWLLLTDEKPGYGLLTGGLSILLSSGVLLFTASYVVSVSSQVNAAVFALSWLPLWFGILLRVSRLSPAVKNT